MPHLQELLEPTRRVDIVPRPILQRRATRSWPERLGALAVAAGGAALVIAGFAAGFFYLLSFRDAETPREVEIPVEVVRDPPKPPAPASTAKTDGTPGGGAPGAAGPKGDPARPDAAGGPPPAAPRPKQPAQDAKTASALSPPASSPLDEAAAGRPVPPAPAPPSPAGETAPPKLVAPQPDAARAATQDKENRPANLVPDEHQVEQATREAKPVAVPRVLTAEGPRAETSVPAPVAPPPVPVDRPTPPTAAKAPSATDRLAAALPMDASAMPSSFRSVLAGNASAQIKAAYSGVIQGRIMQAQAGLAETAYAQRLKGGVAVTFTLDDAGRLVDLRIIQSSGDVTLDDLALRAIRSAAPFPAPPSEADHTFNKAFLVGG